MIATPATLPSDPASASPRLDPLSALLCSSLPISDLAASLGLSIPDFLTLCNSPDFQAQLDAIDDLTQTRLRIHSSQARLTAIQALESLTTSATDPVERRRAASTLIRATCHRSPLGDFDAPATTDAENSPRNHRPRARHLPSRRLRAEQVAALIARALADNDAPTPDSGLATLHTFLSDDTRAASPHLPDFIAAAHDQADDNDERAPADLPLPDLQALTDLLDAPGAATCSAPTQHGRTAYVDLRPPSPTAPHIRVHLTRPDTGPQRMCWLIDRITRTAPPTGPPACGTE